MESTTITGSGASAKRSQWLLQIAVAGFVALAVCYHLGSAAKGFSAYRDQHIGTALEYAKGKIDLMRPIVVGFNAGNTPTALELPIWQAAAAISFKVFGTWFGWANLTSLFFTAAGFWPLFQIARQYLGARGAWWTLLFFAGQPLIFYLGGQASADASCLTFTIWFVFFADRMLRTGQARWWVPAVLFGVLCAVTKAPFFFAAGVMMFFLLLSNHTQSFRQWIMLVTVGAFSVAAFAVWIRYTNALAAQAEFPLVDLRMSGNTGGVSQVWWYFGDWHYRLNPANWVKGGWRFLNSQLGSFALVALLAGGFLCARRGLAQLWFAAAVVTTLVFSHLVLTHTHYYLMFSPSTALLCAMAVSRLEEKITDGSSRMRLCFVGGVVIVLVLSLVQGLTGMKIVLGTDSYPKRITQLIREQTNPDDKLLIQGGGWGGDQLILTDRRGLSIWNTEFLEHSESLARIQSLGYTKLVMISESPLHVAVQQVNPGQTTQAREMYQQHLTPGAQTWPTLLQTDDILIKEIPRAASAK